MASLLDFINSSARIVGRNVDLLAPRGGGASDSSDPPGYGIHNTRVLHKNTRKQLPNKFLLVHEHSAHVSLSSVSS